MYEYFCLHEAEFSYKKGAVRTLAVADTNQDLEEFFRELADLARQLRQEHPCGSPSVDSRIAYRSSPTLLRAIAELRSGGSPVQSGGAT